jgi:GxxExxY protein
MTKKQRNDLTFEIIGCAIEVHKEMGRGLTEKIYHECIKTELISKKISYLTEMKIPVIYKGKSMNVDFRCDLFVENAIVVELKSTQELNNAFEAQLLTHI